MIRSTLQRLAGFVAGLSLAAGALAQTPADTFEFRDASLPDTEARMRDCLALPKADVKSTRDSALSFRGSSETRFTDATAFIVSQAGRWACVPRTAAGRPVWPLEAMDNIATIEGVDADNQRVWRLALLEQLRETGRARGLIRWPGGNGHEVEVELQPDRTLTAKWSSRFMKAGSFDEAAYLIVLRGDGLKSIRSTQLGSAPWHSVVPPRATFWPVEDRWAVLPGTAQTTTARLAGTDWNSDDARLRLEGDGRVTLTATRPRSGTWQVQAPGVLHIQWSDNAFSTLRVTEDDLRLTGILRRTQAPAGNTPSEEFQAAVSYNSVRNTLLPAPALAGVAPPASAPAIVAPSLQYLGAVLVFERELKALGPATDTDTAALLQAPARALWSAARVQKILNPPADIDPLEAAASLTLHKRLAEQLLPRQRAAELGLKTDPEQFADVYVDLADLFLRLSAANVRVAQRLDAGSKPGSDASGTRAAALLMMQTALQAMVKAQEIRLRELPPRQRAQAEVRLQRFRADCADALQLAGDPAPR
ncbi:hypothetical protein [Roseateles sp. P5_E7]